MNRELNDSGTIQAENHTPISSLQSQHEKNSGDLDLTNNSYYRLRCDPKNIISDSSNLNKSCLKNTWTSIVASISQVYHGAQIYRPKNNIDRIEEAKKKHYGIESYDPGMQIRLSTENISKNSILSKTEKFLGINSKREDNVYRAQNNIEPLEKVVSYNSEQLPSINLVKSSLKIMQDCIYIACRENLLVGLDALLNTVIQMIGITRASKEDDWKSQLSLQSLLRVCRDNLDYLSSEKWSIVLDTISLFYFRQYNIIFNSKSGNMKYLNKNYDGWVETDKKTKQNASAQSFSNFSQEKYLRNSINNIYKDKLRQNYLDEISKNQEDYRIENRISSQNQEFGFNFIDRGMYSIDSSRIITTETGENRDEQFIHNNIEAKSIYRPQTNDSDIFVYQDQQYESMKYPQRKETKSVSANEDIFNAQESIENIEEFLSSGANYQWPILHNYIYGICNNINAEASRYESLKITKQEMNKAVISLYNHSMIFEYAEIENIFYSHPIYNIDKKPQDIYSIPNNGLDSSDFEPNNSEILNINLATEYSYNILTTNNFTTRNQNQFVNEIIPRQMICTRLLFSFILNIINSENSSLFEMQKYWNLVSPALVKLSGFKNNDVKNSKSSIGTSIDKRFSFENGSNSSKLNYSLDINSKIESVKIFAIETLGSFMMCIMKKISTIKQKFNPDIECLILPFKNISEISNNLHVQYTILHILLESIVQFNSIIDLPWSLIFEIISQILKKLISLAINYPYYYPIGGGEDILFMVSNYNYNNNSGIGNGNGSVYNSFYKNFTSVPGVNIESAGENETLNNKELNSQYHLACNQKKSDNLAYCRSSVARLASRNIFLSLEIMYFASEISSVLDSSLDSYTKCASILTTALTYSFPSPGLLNSFTALKKKGFESSKVYTNTHSSESGSVNSDIENTDGKKYLNQKNIFEAELASKFHNSKPELFSLNTIDESFENDWKKKAELAIINASSPSCSENTSFGASQIMLSIWQSICEQANKNEIKYKSSVCSGSEDTGSNNETDAVKSNDYIIDGARFPLMMVTKEIFRLMPLLPDLLILNDSLYDSIFYPERVDISYEYKSSLLQCKYKSEHDYEKEKENFPMWTAFDFIRKKLFDILIESLIKIIYGDGKKNKTAKEISEFYLGANVGLEKVLMRLISLPQSFINLEKIFDPWIALFLKWNMIFESNYDILIQDENCKKCFSSILSLNSIFIGSTHDQIYMCGIESYGILLESLCTFDSHLEDKSLKCNKKPNANKNLEKRNYTLKELLEQFTNSIESIILSKCFWGTNSLELLNNFNLGIDSSLGLSIRSNKYSEKKSAVASNQQGHIIKDTRDGVKNLFDFDMYYKESIKSLKHVYKRSTFLCESKSRSEFLMEIIRFVRLICIETEANLLERLYDSGYYELSFRWIRLIFIAQSFSKAVGFLTSSSGNRNSGQFSSESTTGYQDRNEISNKMLVQYKNVDNDSFCRSQVVNYPESPWVDSKRKDFAVRLENLCSFTLIDTMVYLYKYMGAKRNKSIISFCKNKINPEGENSNHLSEDHTSKWLEIGLFKVIKLVFESYSKALEVDEINRELSQQFFDSFGEIENYDYDNNKIDSSSLYNRGSVEEISVSISNGMNSGSNSNFMPRETRPNFFKHQTNSSDVEISQAGNENFQNNQQSQHSDSNPKYLEYQDILQSTGDKICNPSNKEYIYLPLPSLARLVIKSITSLIELLDLCQNEPNLKPNKIGSNSNIPTSNQENLVNTSIEYNNTPKYGILQNPMLLTLIADVIASTDHPEIKKLGASFIKSASLTHF
ncbi:hypothetical protein AYI70_g3688 [Smittium culicis]|uniref:Uncharacterized protein n=1 Tax=Smittium culicis TaxID=133412 RepID=A0A1R1Y2V2_9FUNG|nr:hypothetical protein AYI70_g3688 [Smittium culicis]